MFEAAKRKLESWFGFIVLAGFISPSHDEYVSRKLSRRHSPPIKAEHRLEMCSIAVQDSNWISVSSWESKQKSFLDFPQIALEHKELLDGHFGRNKIQLMFLCGADLSDGRGLRVGGETIPVVAVGRKGFTERVKSKANKRERQQFFLVESELEDFSSTKVREALFARDRPTVERLCGSKVAEYVFSLAL